MHVASHTAEKLTSLTISPARRREFWRARHRAGIRLVDAGDGFQVLAAAEAIEADAGLETVLERVRSTRSAGG